MNDKQPDSGGFTGLGLCQPLLDTIARIGWPEPTPIQQQTIPVILTGQDLFGVAQTGTGKTAAFALPILHELSQQPPAEPLKPYCVVLAPTRELVQQIADQFELLAKGLNLRILIAHGGTSDRPQTSALAAGVEIIVGAPGRVFDLMKQGYLQYAALRYCVLDEADRMFDMGFIDEIRNILNRMPARRQTLMFSATLPKAVQKLASDYLFYPAEIRIGTTGPPKQLNHEAWPVRSDREKEQALRELLDQEHECVLMFCRTKLGASQLARMLSRWGEKVASIHGDRMQSEREKALDSFREGRVRVLVGTDVASRGLDIDGIDLVLNYDTPRDPEDYVHRVGRTARAKRSGIAVSFVLPEEERYLKRIEQFIKTAVPRRSKSGQLEEARGDTGSGQPRKSRSSSRQRSGQRGSGTGTGRDRQDAGRSSADKPAEKTQDYQPRRSSRPQEQPRRDDRPQQPRRPVDDDSTYVDDDAYAPSMSFASESTQGGDAAAQPDRAPSKRRRGSRGGRGRNRDGDSAPPTDSPAE